jgi:hypothetical protein
MPGLTRASTFFLRDVAKDVDGWDKLGHDDQFVLRGLISQTSHAAVATVGPA